jgi:hypothetical protein
MVLKQKLPMDKSGMAFGWFRSHKGARKQWGLYPADHVTSYSG